MTWLYVVQVFPNPEDLKDLDMDQKLTLKPYFFIFYNG